MNDCTTPPESDNLKQCSKCGEWKPATTEYFRIEKQSGRMRRECRTCAAASCKRYQEENADRLREYRRENVERQREYGRKYREENADRLREYRRKNAESRREYKRKYREENADKIHASGRRYRYENSDKVRESKRRYYQANAVALNEKRRKWRKDNPDKVRKSWRDWENKNTDKLRICARARQHRRREHKLRNGGTHTASDIQAQYDNQHGKCWWCGKKIKDTKYHVDHRVPLARGGSNAPENLVIACPKCNQSKGAKLPHEWSNRLL